MRFIILMSCLFALALPAAASEPDHCASGRLPNRRGSHHVELISNKPFVTVRLNDSRPLNFVFDAGSPFTLLNSGLALDLGFTPAPDTVRVGGFAPAFEPTACVRVLGVTLPDIRVGEIELDHISAVEGVRVDGLVGGEVFSQYVVLIDYPRSSVSVFPASFEYRGDGVVLPLEIDGLAFTEGVMQTRDGRSVCGTFIVDTGVRVPLLLGGPFVDRNDLLAGEAAVRGITVGVGVRGETRGDVFRAPGFRMQGLEVRDVIAVASRDEVIMGADDGLAGIIGGDLLRRFRVWFDYPHHRLILETTPHSAERYVYDASGMFLLAEGDGYRTIRVHSVVPRSPADLAGVHAGDRLVSINGRLTRRLGLEESRRLLREENRRYRLGIERDGVMIDREFVTTDLLGSKAATTQKARGYSWWPSASAAPSCACAPVETMDACRPSR